MTGHDELSARREALLLATLPHVAFDGWGLAALRAGAADIGLGEPEAVHAFPDGAADLVEAFSDWADLAMVAGLEAAGLEGLGVGARVALAVRLRLEALAPHREAVRRGLAFLSLPIHAGLGLKCLYRTVDAVWYAVGDRSTDYNFYSKRMLLAGVVSSTLLYWLNDRSEDHAETWAFLERRIAEVIKVGGRLGKGMRGLLELPERLLRLRPGQGGLRGRFPAPRG